MSEQVDYKSIPTPATCYADFCLVPVRTRYHIDHISMISFDIKRVRKMERVGKLTELNVPITDWHRIRLCRQRGRLCPKGYTGQRCEAHDALCGDDTR